LVSTTLNAAVNAVAAGRTASYYVTQDAHGRWPFLVFKGDGEMVSGPCRSLRAAQRLIRRAAPVTEG
jgi:hypothetical protein